MTCFSCRTTIYNHIVTVDDTSAWGVPDLRITGNNILVSPETTPDTGIVAITSSYHTSRQFEMANNIVTSTVSNTQASIDNGIGWIIRSVPSSTYISCTSVTYSVVGFTGPPKYVMRQRNTQLNSTAALTWRRDPVTYNTCTKYCSPNLSIHDFCVIDPVVTTTTPNNAWSFFPELDGIPQLYCTYITLRASSGLYSRKESGCKSRVCHSYWKDSSSCREHKRSDGCC